MKFLSSSLASFLSTTAAAAACVLFAAAGPVHAFCGLQSCPRIDPHGQTHPYTAGVRARVVGFDIAGESGYYGIVSPHLFVKAPFVPYLSVGVEAPWVTLHTSDDDVSGLGNPLLTAQYARRLSHDWSAEAGLQLELPFGDQDDGLADDHYMLLPWVGARYEWGTAWYASGMLGFSQAVGGDDDAAADTGAALAKVAHEGHEHAAAAAEPVLVNPHGDREIHWRAGVGARPLEDWTFEAFGLGQADRTVPATAYYARAGVSAEWAATSAVSLQGVFDAPVTAARRSEWAAGVDVKVVW